MPLEQELSRIVIKDQIEMAAAISAPVLSLFQVLICLKNEVKKCFAIFCKWFCSKLKPYKIDALIEPFDRTIDKKFIFKPIQDYEINKIIRKRLFGEVNEVEVKNIVTKFLEYAEKEKILPSELELSEYKSRFLDSYPFLPDVVDILYHQWGSYPTFQRTRGVLRLLSLVIYSLKESDKPYISLADFKLENQEIRQELLKHIGPEFNSVVSADIIDKTSGSKKVDVSLGDAYRGLALGTGLLPKPS